MTPEGREALEASIAHWRAARAAQHPSVPSIGRRDCALCDLYFQPRCEACPVAIRTGAAGCFGSPYHEALHRFIEWRKAPDSRTARLAWRVAADEQIKFLESLREEAPPA